MNETLVHGLAAVMYRQLQRQKNAIPPPGSSREALVARAVDGLRHLVDVQEAFLKKRPISSEERQAAAVLVFERLASDRGCNPEDLFGKELAPGQRQTRPRQTPVRRVHRAPGFRLYAAIEFLYSKRTFELIFQPAFSDLWNEHAEALECGRIHKARWICIRGTYSIVAAAFAQIPVSLLRWAVALWTLGS